jgi:acyl-CoA synthetase (AMP-forming)/AMP-acid ligase II
MSDYFLDLASRAPDAITGWRAERAVRHDQFLLRVGAWRSLARRTPGRTVALFFSDSIEFAAALVGAWQGGKTVWLSADTLPASCDALARSVDAFFGEFPAQYAPMLPAADERCTLAFCAPDADFPALVVHTSGTTGAAQAIPKRMSQLTSEVATLEKQFGARVGNADIVATVSHQHIYGLLFKVLWPLGAGRAIHARSLNFPEEMAELLGRRDCVLVASPAHLKRLPGHLDWSAAARRLAAVFSSGGMLDADVAFAAGALLGQVPVEVYGSSETGGIAWRQRQPGMVDTWQALPQVEWRVGADGDLLEVRSPHIGADSWLTMADRVRVSGEAGGSAHAGARFMLLGRGDRIVKIEEKRISLDAIEASLVASGLALEARVIAAPEVAGQRQALAAFVVPSPEANALLENGGKLALNRRLRELLAGTVEAVAIPRRWRYLDAMPINAQGKTTYSELLALLAGGADAREPHQGRPRLPRLRLLEREPHRVLFELTVPATLLYFDGHFPVAPVLPGVVQVDWAIHYARAHFELGPVFRAIHALKFQNVIRAETPVQLELTHDEAKGSLAFRYFSDAGQHAGGRILFGPQ